MLVLYLWKKKLVPDVKLLMPIVIAPSHQSVGRTEDDKDYRSHFIVYQPYFKCVIFQEMYHLGIYQLAYVIL